MDSTEIEEIIRTGENERVEFRAVLPPSGNIARLISALGNSHRRGGYIILGVAMSPSGVVEVHGLSSDFRVLEVVHQAIDKVEPRPKVEYDYVLIEGKQLFAIKVEETGSYLYADGVSYQKKGGLVVPMLRMKAVSQTPVVPAFQVLGTQIEKMMGCATASKKRVLGHYQSILRILEDTKELLILSGAEVPTDIPEGKVLSRVMYSYMVDNFEGYLSDLLYEIFLARPEALRSSTTVTVEEVLKCGDMQEFIQYVARERARKLQKGSVGEFIKENTHISSLRVLDKDVLEEVGRILEVRHLFTHRNGVVDEKFLRGYSTDLKPGEEFRVSVEEICGRMGYLVEVIDRLDLASVEVYKLDTIY